MGCGPSSEKKQKNTGMPDSGPKNNAVGNGEEVKGEPRSPGGRVIGRKQSARLGPGIGEAGTIRQRYKLHEVIGQGRFGVVYKAESRFGEKREVAIKILKHNCYTDKKAIMDEIKILKDLDHPNIVNYYEEIEDGPYIFIVTEYCSGGELFDRIAGKESFGEVEAAKIMWKLFSAINHCHSQKIAHRDIKPENILYSSKKEDAEVKLIDFGLAKKSERSLGTYSTMVGTPFYLAPEVIDGNYGNSCDIWSLGIVLHVMLSGYMPFSGANTDEILKNVKGGKLNLTGPIWSKVSPQGKDFVQVLLTTDEFKRPSAEKALTHPWFEMAKSHLPSVGLLDGTILKSMTKYKGTSPFQKICMKILVKTLKEEDINNLIEVFNLLDKKKTGYIGIVELINAFHERYPQADIKKMIENLNLADGEQINYSQFISATIDAKKFLTHERLWALFKYFDASESDHLCAQDIKEVFNQAGMDSYTLDDIYAMLKQDKIKNPEKISFPEFATIMTTVKFEPGEDVLNDICK